MNQASRVGLNVGCRGSLPRPTRLASSRDGEKRDMLAFVVADAEQIGTVEEMREPSYLAAIRLYQRERWQRAFEQFAELADEGNAAAARFALLMLRYGTTVYGTSFLAQPAQVARWALYVLGRLHRAVRSHQA